MLLQAKQVASFQKKILSWYAENKRDLPWRGIPYDLSLQARDPYKILLSEVMSQQTQLTRVIPKYEAWLKEFPTVESLAVAKTSDILRLWSGLGYNRRALFLQKTAQAIVLQGRWPRDVQELEKLPGIGAYTARAIACFAFNEEIAVVDTNIRKVISHEFFNGQLPDEKIIEKIAQELLPKGSAYDWNQALMDYSAMILKDKKIPVPKQSRFLSSNRYFRGKLLKELLICHELTLDQVRLLLREGIEKFGEAWFHPFLQQLKKDGFITLSSDNIKLVDG